MEEDLSESSRGENEIPRALYLVLVRKIGEREKREKRKKREKERERREREREK